MKLLLQTFTTFHNCILLIWSSFVSVPVDRPVSSVTRQPSDRRPAAGNAGAPTLSTQASVSATDNANAPQNYQGAFASPKNGAHTAGTLPSTVTEALAAQGIDISAGFKDSEKQQPSRWDLAWVYRRVMRKWNSQICKNVHLVWISGRSIFVYCHW